MQDTVVELATLVMVGSFLQSIFTSMKLQKITMMEY